MRGMMDWYLVYSGTVPVSGVEEKLNVPNCDWYVHNFGVHQNTIRYIENAGGTVLTTRYF
jgi:hypothetical protein